MRLPRPRVRVTWDRQPPTDRFVGVAWGRHWTSYTWGIAVGFGPRAVTLHLPPPVLLRHRLRLWAWGFPSTRHAGRLYELADLLVTPERYGAPVDRLASEVVGIPVRLDRSMPVGAFRIEKRGEPSAIPSPVYTRLLQEFRAGNLRLDSDDDRRAWSGL